MELFGYFNGKILPVNKISVGVHDLGFLRSYSVFDYLRTYNGQPFLLKQHLTRFASSAGELHLKIPLRKEETERTIGRLLTRSGIHSSSIKKTGTGGLPDGIKQTAGEAGIRLILTGGYSSDSMTPLFPNFIILIEKLQEYPPSVYTKGVKLMTCEYQRLLPHAKSTNYLNAIRLKPYLKSHHAFELLYRLNGELLETSRNNFFIVRKKKRHRAAAHQMEAEVITPYGNILPGITRKLILNLAKKKFTVAERAIFMDEIRDADEAFISGTTRRITPVIRIDNTWIGNGKVGDVTKALMKMFDDFVYNECYAEYVFKK